MGFLLVLTKYGPVCTISSDILRSCDIVNQIEMLMNLKLVNELTMKVKNILSDHDFDFSNNKIKSITGHASHWSQETSSLRSSNAQNSHATLRPSLRSFVKCPFFVLSSLLNVPGGKAMTQIHNLKAKLPMQVAISC